MFGAQLQFEFKKKIGNGREIPRQVLITHLPKDQAKRIYTLAQEKEEEWLDKRRMRKIEEERARSGASQIVVGNNGNGNGNSELKSKLRELKDLLDDDLITQDEYNRKKEKILNNI